MLENNIAIIDSYGNNITYKRLIEYGQMFVNEIGNRSIVMILCKSTWQEISIYSILVRNNIVPMLIPWELNRESVLEIQRKYKIQYVISETFADNRLSNYTEVYCLEGYSLYRANHYQPNLTFHKDLALLMTTSGSTGSPKMVRISYDNLKANTESIVEYLHITPKERAILALPMTYVYGLSIINTHLYAKATLLVCNYKVYDARFWYFFNQYKGTSISGVPYMYEFMDRFGVLNKPMPTLRYFTQAGGKLSIDYLQKYYEFCKKNGIKFIVMYGQSEATARIAYLPFEMSETKLGSIGHAIPGGKLWLIDEHGNKIKESNVCGELIYQGKNVVMGYSECFEDLSKENEWNGILHTGDLATCDEDGYYYICGRLKRIAKIHGNRINLDELDSYISKVTNHKIISKEEKDRIVLFTTDLQLKLEDCRIAIETKNLRMDYFELEYINEIPYSVNGKIDYTSLRDKENILKENI